MHRHPTTAFTDLNWHVENGLDAVWSETPLPLVGQTPVAVTPGQTGKAGITGKAGGKRTSGNAVPSSPITASSITAKPASRTVSPASAARADPKSANPAHSAGVYKGPEVKNPELLALYQEICAFEDCSLKETAISTVIADGNTGADIMVIGEAPGADEDRSGLPFVGTAGLLLDRMMAAIGLNRTNVLVSNMVFWRPPGNRKPTQNESEICLNFTKRHLELVRPKIVLMAGALSAQKLLETNDGITRLRGKWAAYRLADGTEIQCMPLLHPAYLLRQPRYKRESWIDLLTVKQKLIELELL